MLRNVSYNNPQINREILKAVGGSYSWVERIKFGGTGSPKLPLIEASSEIAELLNRDNNFNYCNIEICWNGVIIRFRSLLETYGLIIPFHQLGVFKAGNESYSIFLGEHKIKVEAEGVKVHKFFIRLLELRAKQSGSRIEDL
ncbi:MAG: hypothetical protein QMB45_09960 [Flavobacteriales bacterium]|jgi:hypothetical protein|tara:strand:- start:399 stop:824 length:426 start_codon:yes stop_codon:yes gene_type:complete